MEKCFNICLCLCGHNTWGTYYIANKYSGYGERRPAVVQLPPIFHWLKKVTAQVTRSIWFDIQLTNQKEQRKEIKLLKLIK